MRIAAIISLPEGAEESSAAPGFSFSRRSSHTLRSSSYASLDILGESLLQRTRSKLRDVEISRHTLISSGKSPQLLPSGPANAKSFGQWESAVANYLSEGVDHLMLLRVSAYSDIEFADLLQYHIDTCADFTQAYAADGALDIALLNAAALRKSDQGYSRTIGELIDSESRYVYRGYVNRLANPADFYKLVQDGLRGRCGLRPAGRQVQERVWFGPGAQVDDTAVISGPAFIGSGTRIAACCTIAAGSAIERGCEVDCGTAVEESWVTQETYLGVGLDVRRSVVRGDALFHVDRNVEVKIGDRQLIGSAARPISSLASLGSFLLREGRLTG